jgi:hypothetical protein
MFATKTKPMRQLAWTRPRAQHMLNLKLFTATALAVTLGIGFFAAPAAAKARFDFEQQGWANEWAAERQITVTRKPIPAADGVKGPKGHGVRLNATGKAGFICKAGKLPSDMGRYANVGLWVHRSPSEAKRHPSSTIEIQFYERDGKSRLWSKVELNHEGWAHIKLPLKWFRWSEGKIPRWKNVIRMGIWFRDAAEIVVDEFKLTAGNTPTSAVLLAADLRLLAFGDKAESELKIAKADGIVVMSDAADLDADQLLAHLQKVQQNIEADLPFLNEPSNEIPLLVFAKRNDYQQFFPRLASRLGAEIAPPSSPGFTMQGVSASSWDVAQGSLRPVYAHEFVHALLSSRYDLPNKGEWVQEGLASYYQLKATPQPNFGDIVRQSLADPAAFLPLETLCNGQSIPLDRYWQAVTVCDMLLNNNKYKRRTPDLFAKLREVDSTDLEPHLEPLYGVTWDEFRSDWKNFCSANYAEKES